MSENYYASPEPFDYQNPNQGPKLPGYVKGWCITDLVFCSLRVPLLLLGFVGLANIPPDHPIYITAFFEVLTGLGICIFGLTGNIMLLLRKPLSIIICWISVVSTLGSIAVGVWQAFLQFGALEPGSPELIGGMVGGGIAFVFRVGLLLLYCIALIRAQAYFASRADDPRPANILP